MNSIYEEVRIALHNVWRRRWLALAVAWAIALLGWLVISTIPNKYESKASVYVQTSALLPEKVGISPGERQKAVETIQRTLLSADNLQKVVRGTELGRDVTTPRQLADKAEGLRSHIEIVAQQDNLFEISASSGSSGLSNAQNAKLSKDIVQKMLDLFVEGTMGGGRVETTQTLRFLDEQLLSREQALRDAEAKRVAFEQKYLGILPDSGGSLGQRMDAARSELNQLESNLMSANGALAALNGQLASTQPSISTPGTMIPGSTGGAAARAAALEGQISEAQSRGWTDNHPDMVALRSQLGRARAAAASEGGGGARMSAGSSSPNPMYVTLRSMQAEKQATAAALSARRAQLQAELAQFASKQVEEPGIAAEQQRLNRDYEVLKGQYDKMLADREDVRLRGSVQSETNSMQFKVIEPPLAPRSPVAPNRPLLLTIVLLAALGAGAGAAFAISQVKASYPTAARLAKASGLPVIGSISEFLPVTKRDDARLKMKYFAGCTAALVAAWVLLLVVEFIQRSMVA
jgi:polysaccharide biosynthesis transport protein